MQLQKLGQVHQRSTVPQVVIKISNNGISSNHLTELIEAPFTQIIKNQSMLENNKVPRNGSHRIGEWQAVLIWT